MKNTEFEVSEADFGHLRRVQVLKLLLADCGLAGCGTAWATHTAWAAGTAWATRTTWAAGTAWAARTARTALGSSTRSTGSRG